MLPEKVRHAVVELSDGKPYSPEFDDIYATRSGAFGQACAVFLSDGEIAARWRGQDTFTILENGIGLGTNFLATLQTWRNDPCRSDRLEYVALECFPVSAAQVLQFAAPELTAEARELAAQWPVCIPGYHTLSFDNGRVRLILIFGDSQVCANRLSLQYDSLYLDGFGPEKNPRMWEKGLLRAFSRYAKEGATVTSWCTKGEVRRALTEAGFEIQKKPGFGKKRERLFGVMRARRTKQEHRKVQDVIIVGAGLAGANLAYSLSLQGIKARVVDASPVPGAAASALSWGILHPHFTRDDSPLSKMSREGFLLSRSRLKELQEKTSEHLFEPLGCLQMAHSDEIFADWKNAQEHSLPFELPPEYGRLLLRQEASQVSAMPLKRGGWFFPMAGMARSGAYCRALIKASGVCYRGNTDVVAIRKKGARWQLLGQFGEVIDEAGDVVVCAANASSGLLKFPHLGLEALPGRITLLRDTDLTSLRCPVSGEGYIAHLPDGYCGVGATYELERTGPWSEEKAHENNLAKLDSLLTEAASVVVTGGYFGIRAAGPGRLPVVGASVNEADWLDIWRVAQHLPEDDGQGIEQGLWVLAGLGSRGLSMSALCAEILTSMMTGSAMPAEPSLVKTLAPSRYLRRQWLKGKIS